jgi:hypothetical protein
MLDCYLDDSGTDPQNRVTTVAGYVAERDAWQAFEAQVEPIFANYGVDVLHAVDLHRTEGEFQNWPRVKKQSFVTELCAAMAPHVSLGLSMSVVKSTYAERAAESARKRTVTPYTFCNNVIIDWILRDIRIGRAANTEGVSFILETGNEHNAEAEINFNAVAKLHKLDGILRSISFVPKRHCRAIQMADLIAFYSRRHGVAMEKAPIQDRGNVTPTTMMNIIAGSVPTRAFVATDFENAESPWGGLPGAPREQLS